MQNADVERTDALQFLHELMRRRQERPIRATEPSGRASDEIWALRNAISYWAGATQGLSRQ